MRAFPPVAIGLFLLACGGACGGGGTSGPTADGGSSGPDSNTPRTDSGSGGEATDFGSPGPHSVSESSGQTTVNGCNMGYTLFAPDGASDPGLVVLGHGFSRSQAQMADIARHVASFGARVVTPDFCHLSALDTDHPQNGRDAAALSAELANGSSVVHVGYSAGGLAAVLAAQADAAAVGFVGLDLVDADGLGVAAAGSLSIPGFGMVGDPSMCNSDNNGVAVYAPPGLRAVRIPGATHCDFEQPTGGLCTSFCGAQGAAIDLVKTLAAAYVSAALGIDATGAAWTEPGGSEFDRLVGDGSIVVL